MHDSLSYVGTPPRYGGMAPLKLDVCRTGGVGVIIGCGGARATVALGKIDRLGVTAGVAGASRRFVPTGSSRVWTT